MPDLEIWTNDTDTVICHGRDDIVEIYREFVDAGLVPDVQDEINDGEWEQVDLDQTMTIYYKDGVVPWMEQYKGTTSCAVDDDDDNVFAITLTGHQWITEEGRCFLCSTEY